MTCLTQPKRNLSKSFPSERTTDATPAVANGKHSSGEEPSIASVAPSQSRIACAVDTTIRTGGIDDE